MAQAIALIRWRRRPVWLAVVAGVRFSDLFTDLSYVLVVPILTSMGWTVSERSTVEVDGQRLSLSNLDKVLYPDGFTKGEVVDYYARIAPVLLPPLLNLLGVVIMMMGFGQASGFATASRSDQGARFQR